MPSVSLSILRAWDLMHQFRCSSYLKLTACLWICNNTHPSQLDWKCTHEHACGLYMYVTNKGLRIEHLGVPGLWFQHFLSLERLITMNMAPLNDRWKMLMHKTIEICILTTTTTSIMWWCQIEMKIEHGHIQ